MTSALAQDIKLSGVCVDQRNNPIEGVIVRGFLKQEEKYQQYTDSNGVYSFRLNYGDTLLFKFLVQGYQDSAWVVVKTNQNQRLPRIKFPFQQENEVKVEVKKEDPFEISPLKIKDLQTIPLGSVERAIIYTTPATSNNELTSNYNVRGGSYEENLVYVNGYNIYRPFLTRSGQQEGMSFVNTALVEDIQFSAGGFNASYGDKLSSVLDITYKTPVKTSGSVMASLLGAEASILQEVNHRFNYLVGARYRTNKYLLNSLPTKGNYNPVYLDAQVLTNFALTDRLTWGLIGHFSSNTYQFAPQTQKTDFGTANEAYSFNIYFDGQELTRFQTMMGGTSFKYKPTKSLDLDFYATVFNTNERETYDIQGQYFINELETDPSKETYGDSIAVLGIGTFLNHARNQLKATIVNVYHNGTIQLNTGFKDEAQTKYFNHKLFWGLNFQKDYFDDHLSEWKMVDSAGYSIPQTSGELKLFETIKGDLNLQNERFSGHLMWNSYWNQIKKKQVVSVRKKVNEKGVKVSKTFVDTIPESIQRIALNVGLRSGYTAINQEFYLTPRMSVTYFPRAYMVNNGKLIKRGLSYKFATGMYYQPPFYREFRTFEGQLNTQVKAQKSMHAILSTEVFFTMLKRERPFKFSADAYYKYLWDVNPYEIDNVRTRYYANNDAVAYAYGVDLNIHGEFVKGIESYFKLGILSTKEDLRNDAYKEYYNAAGEKIIFGYSSDQTVVDSATIYPKWIPRPTDQLLNFGALIQDQMPTIEQLSVQVGIQFGSRLPYGPPDRERYKDTLRMKSYFRVDIGTSYDFLYKRKLKNPKKSYFLKDAILSFEVFNLLGINNVLSKQWIQDVSGKYYSIPNYLSQRRFNLKLIVRF